MYFPYLRGRQAELLAIRRLLEEGILSDKVVPLIEPIKPTPTLRKTLELFINKQRNIFLISNPQVGGFIQELSIKKEENESFGELLNNKHINHINIIKEPDDFHPNSSGYILENIEHINWFKHNTESRNSKLLFIPDRLDFRRNLRDESMKVLHANYFRERERNADYLQVPSSVFSTAHLFYKDEGYYGFSDYSIIGDSYMEGGFPPRAIAIHMVYFSEELELRISHFTSESNDDIKNPAGKFHEALQKLVVHFNNNQLVETFALTQFREHDQNGTYPGLGTVKQLSIMHHLELIGKYLDGSLR